ncbi:NAD(+)/NADH kinase [Candidatus Woesearchaeota archaeon]|nr:NAD(+)/NADH kinase [Candidatus Woesearchaeota archaeon]
MKFKNILVVYSEKLSRKHFDNLAEVKKRLEGRNFFVLRADRLIEKYFENIDLIITVGGDGTFIRAASFVKEIPIIGINSESEHSEGALLSLDEHDIKFLGEILDDKHKIKKIPRIKVKINGKELSNLALNEIYFGSLNQFHTSKYSINFNGLKEEQRSSGVLVATASGSTAWYKSARGRPFKGNKLRFIIREPYFGNRIFNPKLLKGEIKNGGKIIFVSKRHSGGIIALDSNYKYKLEKDDTVEVEMSEYPLKVITKKL